MQKTIRQTLLRTALAGSVLASAASQAAECDTGAGQQVFQSKCSACHALAEDHVGPRLAGVVGRPIGKLAGYTYSTDLAGANADWSLERLDSWLAAPAKMFPETAMAFGGLRKAEDRQAVLCFLRQQR